MNDDAPSEFAEGIGNAVDDLMSMMAALLTPLELRVADLARRIAELERRRDGT